MTEAEWLGCDDPERMLTFAGGKVSGRKLRLFAVACCRRIWHMLTDKRCRRAVEVAEHYADGRANAGELAAAQEAVEGVHAGVDPRWGAAWGVASAEAVNAAWETLREAAGWGVTALAERRAFAPLLRDVFGPLPFRPFPHNTSWRTPAVLALARTVYAEGRFEDMPILADALEETRSVR
jgi:hypothetical protein